MIVIDQNCKLHQEKLNSLNSRIDKLEEAINRFTIEDWREYRKSISDELKAIKREIEKMDKNHESHESRITKLEIMFENTIKAINDNSATVKELNARLSEIAEQLAEIRTESRLNDKHLERSLDKRDNLDKLLDKSNRPLLLLIVVVGSALLLSLGANMSDIVKLFKPF